MKALLRDRLSVLITLCICILLYGAAGVSFRGFFSAQVALNFLTDNAFIGVIAVGLTLVILTGGIDLSVGSMAGLSAVVLAALVEHRGVPPGIAALLCLSMGALLGWVQGYLVAKWDMAPFLVTLAGLFLCRGIGLWVSNEAIQIQNKTIGDLALFTVPMPGDSTLGLTALVYLAVLGLGVFVAKQTRFGRTLYAIGGNKASAHLMGLTVSRSLTGAYVASGVCAALGGLLFSLYTSSGTAVAGTGMELDAIAAVVMGGTLLSGGYGSVLGSFLGVLLLGIIQTAITFQGSLSSWWGKIAIGALLLLFLMLQRSLVGRRETG